MLTKDRIAPTLAVLAGIVGLVLVFSSPHSDADDDGPEAPATSRVVPAPGGRLPPSAAPAPGRPDAVSPAPQAPRDDDGDGDGDGDGDDN